MATGAMKVFGGHLRILMTASTNSTRNYSTKSMKKLKKKGTLSPLPSSQLGKYLEIPEPRHSDTTKIISKFIKLHNPQNLGKRKKALLTDEVLKTVMEKKDGIGMPEFMKIFAK